MSKGSGLIRNISILTGLSIASIHVINRIETTSACAEPTSRTREDKTYNWRYGIIDYKVKGYGSPILLLHDLTIGSSKAEYKYIYDTLSRNRKVYVPDLLGYGISDKPVIASISGIIFLIIESKYSVMPELLSLSILLLLK